MWLFVLFLNDRLSILRDPGAVSLVETGATKGSSWKISSRLILESFLEGEINIWSNTIRIWWKCFIFTRYFCKLSMHPQLSLMSSVVCGTKSVCLIALQVWPSFKCWRMSFCHFRTRLSFQSVFEPGNYKHNRKISMPNIACYTNRWNCPYMFELFC